MPRIPRFAVYLLTVVLVVMPVQAQVKGEAAFIAAANNVNTVFTIAPSISTRTEARKARSRFELRETTDANEAETILVVIKNY